MADPSMALLQFWQFEPDEADDDAEDEVDNELVLEVRVFGGDESLVDDDRVEEEEEVLAAAPGVRFCNFSSN